MTWNVSYHPEVKSDLKKLGKASAKRCLKVIKKRIQEGEPDKTGKPLSGQLAGYRRIRTGNFRIVYSVNGDDIEIFVIAVGARRNEEVYKEAESRNTE